jgi:hypothetical protein
LNRLGITTLFGCSTGIVDKRSTDNFSAQFFSSMIIQDNGAFREE